MNCEGTFSPCSVVCELAGDRNFTETIAKSGNGLECPAAEDCKPGNGTCKGNSQNFTHVPVQTHMTKVCFLIKDC